MEYYQKLMIIILAGVIILGAGALVLNDQNTTRNNNTNLSGTRPEALELLVRNLEFGKNSSSYSIEFSEDTDGYQTQYKVERSAESKVDKISVSNILSEKQAYFFNQTAGLCIQYNEEAACTDVTTNADLTQYLNFLKSKFPSQEQMARNVADVEFLYEAGYLKITEVVNGTDCTKIKYTLDFSDATISDGARFGIGLNSPKKFAWEICISKENYQTKTREFNYTLPNDGSFHTFKYRLIESRMNNPSINLPEIIDDGEAVRLIYQEKTVQGEITKCLIKKTQDEKEGCVIKKAIEMRMPKLCQVALSKKDNCYIALAPLMHQEEVCLAIQNPLIKDDCYIEIAAGKKDETYCAKISNQEKQGLCTQTVEIAKNPRSTNQTTSNNQSTTNSTVDPVAQRLFDQIG